MRESPSYSVTSGYHGGRWTASHVRRGVERGERNVGLINIVRLASALGVPSAMVLERIR
jgi:hypothetical protein